MPPAILVMFGLLLAAVFIFFTMRLFTRYLALEIDEYSVLQALDVHHRRSLKDVNISMHRLQLKKDGMLEKIFWPVDFKLYYLLNKLARQGKVEMFRVQSKEDTGKIRERFEYQLSNVGRLRYLEMERAYMHGNFPSSRTTKPSGKTMRMLAVILLAHAATTFYVREQLPYVELSSAMFMALPLTSALILTVLSLRIWRMN